LVGVFPSGSKAVGDSRPSYVEELTAIGKRLQEAVLKTDIKTLLAYDPNNEAIGGIVYDAYRQDESELRARSSHLYCYLFDTRCLNEIAAKFSGSANPFMRTSIRDFLAMHSDLRIEVFVWPKVAQGLSVASVIYVTPAFKDTLAKALQKKTWDWPYDKWGKEFVACDLVRVEQGWRYYARIFKVAVAEE
jgi:hypothetical protein